MSSTTTPPSTQRKIPLCVADLGEEEIRAVSDVLRSGWLAHGPANHEFEELFAKYLGVPYCVSLNSCASALFLAVHANNIKGEVILPSFTFVASANAVAAAGAQCKLVDVDYDTCNINVDAVEAAITPRTEAIMPVHYAGQAADMEKLAQLAAKKKLLLIEDSAEAIGAEINGKRTGRWGIGCFSFYPTKNITTGEGGMFTTTDQALADKARAIGGHGIMSTTFAREKKERPWLRAATYAGFNFRMSSVLAALGVVQMKKVDRLNDARRVASAQLNTLLDKNFFDLPVERPGYKHVYQMYTVKTKGLDRTKFLEKMRALGIGATVHFDPPVHQQPFYEAYGKGADLKVTEQIAACIATLPMYPGLTEDDVRYMAKSANAAAQESRK